MTETFRVLRSLAPLASLLGLLAACGSGLLEAESVDGGEVSVAIALSKAAQAQISRAEVLVSGDDMVDIRVELTVSGSTMSGRVTGIPSGANRRFTINAYDASGSVVYSGSATADITTGQTTTVSITLRSTSGSAGSVTIEVASTATASRPTYEGVTTIRGEISNGGSAAATGVEIQMRARNGAGAAVSDGYASVGTIDSGGSKLFSASFSNTCYSGGSYVGCSATYVSSVDYTVSYNEGSDLTGSILVQ